MVSVIDKRLVVIYVPKVLIKVLEWLGAKKTILRHGHQIKSHMHRFLAVYFTMDVRYVETGSGRKELPASAMVIVLPRTIHGWVDTLNDSECGVVSHFHRGHPAHVMTKA